MKLIFIRGVPGTGKTFIANKIKKILNNSEIICVDEFKLEAMSGGANFSKALEIAYEKAIRKLYYFYEKNKDYIILEEIINNKFFFKRLYEFSNNTKSDT